MANKKQHLLEKERFCIEKMLKAGESFGEIARVLERGRSTVSEEVKKNGGRKRYDAARAQKRAYLKQYRKKKGCNAVARNGPLSRYVERCLSLGWSPETISARVRKEGRYPYASPKSIRKFITSRPSLERFLFWNRVDRKSGPKRGGGVYLRDPERKFIETRPSEALTEYGHWELDFIVSAHNSWVLLVMVERYSKLAILVLLPNRTNDLVNGAVSEALKGYTVHTLTLDNDIAFAQWKNLEELTSASAYFCHPYHSWEKGLVENTNRWIRQFVPKKTNLALLTEGEVKDIEAWLNHMPRQCLDGKTAYETMMEKEYGKLMTSLEVSLPVRIGG